MLVELNEENFDKETKNGLKLVEFYTTWCTYCRNQRIELQELEDSDIWIGLLDADECPQFAKKYGVTGFPTFVLLKNGEKIAEFVGFHQKAQLLNRLMNYIV
ncbi:thioredoxin family protein [bacterium]|nr:thioredoxin family protein [bacterium]MBO5446107.1 thioredoxin family protein [bacterium]